ncbi:gag-pol polyprotein [Tanacetum coccineum]|uniref:Gag-pol polyprotein n=1 Tax=Tanacetum coccineum TaxID=301880 RepID=A0ABQ4YEJ3_9ASTR
MSKVLQKRGSESILGSTDTNPRDHVKLISTTVKVDTPSIRHRKEYATNLKRLLKEKPRMGYQIDASTNTHDSAILEDSLPPKEKYLGSFTIPCYINNICFKKALADLGASISVMPYSTFTNLGLGELAPTRLIIELADRTIKRPKGIAENVLVRIDKFVFPVDFVVLDMPEDIKVPLILGRPFLSTAHAKINVFKRKITLRVVDDKIMYKSDKSTSNIIKRVFALGLRERMKLDLDTMLIGEALILNRSLDPTYGDYIELNDLNEPLELKRNQVEDLGPTAEEGEVIDEPIEDIVETRNDDDEISNGIDEYPSFCYFDRKIHIDCAYNLQFSCMIVAKNIDAYRDEGLGDVIVKKPFCREIYVKAMQFDGMITIYNGNGGVTYQMARSHPRFKHLTNAQCNKMRPLLKVSAHDMLNVISHPYQKPKSFYKGVLNLGPEYIRDLKIEELLTRGHVSIHEME